MKIRNKLVTYFLIVLIVPVLVLSFILLRNSQINLKDQIVSKLETLADIRKYQVEHFFQSNIEIIKVIAGTTIITENFAEYNKTPTEKIQDTLIYELGEPIVSLKEIKVFSLINLSGTTIASTDKNDVGTNVSKEPFFIEGKNNPGVYFVSENGVTSISFVAPVFFQGKVIGLARSIVDINFLERLVKDKIGLGKTGEVLFAVQDSNKNPLFVVKREFESQAISSPDNMVPIISAVNEQEKVLSSVNDYRGVKVIAVTRYFKDLNAGLVVKVDESEIYSPLRNVLVTTIVVSIFGVLLTILIAWFLSNNFSNPIKELTDITKRFSKDNLQVPFSKELLESEDEIGVLSSNFKSMMESLSCAYTSMKETGKSLLKDEEELLKVSTDRYKALFVSSRDAVMTLEGPSWKFSSGNPAAIKMFGAKNEGDFLFYEPWDLSPKFQPDGSDSTKKAKEMIEKAMREGSNFFEWTHKRINGEEFPAEVLLSRVDQDGKKFLHALVRDITERKRLAEKLKEYAEERFKVIFDNTNDGIVLADLETKHFILSNDAFSKMIGYTPDEILKLSITDIHPPEDLPHVFEQFEKQARKEIEVARDLRVKRKDGALFYCDVNSSPVIMNGKKYMLGIFRNITDRKISEEALRESEEQFRKIFENGQYGIILTGADSRFFKVNPTFCKMLGYTESELIGKKFSEITHADNVKSDTESVPRMINGEIPNYQTEKRYIKKNGQEIWVSLIVSVIRNADGSFRYFLGMVEDISERRKLDEAKSGFLAMTSHQLRTPLTATKWVLETLEDDKDLTPKQKDKIDDLVTSNNRIINLVERLLNVTRIESGKVVVRKEFLDIKNLVEEVLKDVDSSAREKKKNIKVVAPKKLDKICSDPVLIREALENLLVNAIDYSGENFKEIRVAIENRTSDYLVSVHNEGFIEESLVARINRFDKFVRGDEASNQKPGGSGLGLFIVKKVIEANGGTFWFESNIKLGTTFYFTIEKSNLKE